MRRGLRVGILGILFLGRGYFRVHGETISSKRMTHCVTFICNAVLL